MSIRLRTMFVVLVLTLVGGLAALNWSAFTAPTTLNLLLARIEFPLGLLMLGIVAALTGLYVVLVVSLETRALWEARRQSRELSAQRRLADSAEGSRYAELRSYLEEELEAVRAARQATDPALWARLDRIEESLRRELERAARSLAGSLRELEERLTRSDRRAGEPALASPGSRGASVTPEAATGTNGER